MKFLQLGTLLLCAVLLCGCDKGANQPVKTESESPAASGSDETASSANAGEAGHFLIDVRSQKEWDAGHLETAIHIPHTEIVEGIKKVTDDKSAKIYLH